MNWNSFFFSPWKVWESSLADAMELLFQSLFVSGNVLDVPGNPSPDKKAP